jgi:hypothetical protein
MSPKAPPPISEQFIFAEDAKLAAQLSCAFARPGIYVPVCDGPRMQRPDHHVEVLRRHNVAGRARAKAIYFAGLPDNAFEALQTSLNTQRNVSCHRVSSAADIPLATQRELLRWGRDRIGVGLLKALREGKQIIFDDKPSPGEWVSSKSRHVVVCEEGEEISQVIAANYAFALDAGLALIPEVDDETANDIVEEFYKSQDGVDGVSPSEAQARLSGKLLDLCGSLPIPEGGSITFIGQLPYGFAYPEYPSTHLFDYPDLGCAIINGFGAEQNRRPPVGVVVFVDPDTTPAPEIESAIRLLEPRGAFIRVYQGPGADVRRVSEMIEHFPYDLLMIATHCGDSSGYRWTYEFTDSEGLPRTVVVDLAVGFARTDDPDMFKVGHYYRFVSLDGVDWTDRAAKAKMYVGKAILDFTARLDDDFSKFEPTRKETIERVIGSAALKMSDSNLLFAQHTIAGVGTPIVINNACLSWHRLAGDMTFAGARAYIGTLFPVLPLEAADVVTKLLDDHWGKPLSVALWAAQRDIYGSSLRRPYVMAGVFTQTLHVDVYDYPNRIRKKIGETLAGYREMLGKVDASDVKRIEAIKSIIKIHEGEYRHFSDHQTEGLGNDAAQE